MSNLIALGSDWRIWLAKSGYSILDQGLISGTMFLLNIALARWLTPDEYGTFAIAFSVFLFLSGFQNAIILEPMSVIGPSRYKDQFQQYIWSNLLLHGVFSFGTICILAISALLLSSIGSPLAPSIFGLAISAPTILLFWLFRRVCYIRAKPEIAFTGSIVYAAIVSSAVVFSKNLEIISPLTAFLILALASAGTSLLLFMRLNLKLFHIIELKRSSLFRSVLNQHWTYGRWVIGSAFVNSLVGAIYVPFVGIFLGLSQAGAYKAIQNLMLPIDRSITALGLLVLPWISSQRKTGNDHSLRRITIHASAITSLVSIIYVVIISIGGRWIIEILYDQPFYVDQSMLVPLFGMSTILMAVGFGFSVILKAFEYPKAIFLAQTAGAVITLTAGILLIQWIGLKGAGIGQALSAAGSLIVVITIWTSLWKKMDETDE